VDFAGAGSCFPARAAGAPNPIAITVAVAISGAAFILRVSLQDRVIPIHHDAVITDRLDELPIVAIGGRWRCQTIPPVAMAVAAMVRNHTSACCTSRLARGNAHKQTHSETSSNCLCTNDGVGNWRTPVGRVR
jgi:hypothetical protein